MSDRSATPWEMNRRILADRAIDAGQKCLLLVIVDLAGHGRRPCTASYQRLADGAGMTRRNAIGVVKKLRDGGYIAVQDARAGSSGGIRIELGASLLDPAFLPPNGEARFTTNGETRFTTNGETERMAMVKSSVGNGETERTAMVKPASPKRLNTGAAETSSSNVAPRTDDGDDVSTLEEETPERVIIPAEVIGEIRDILGRETADEVAANPGQMNKACRGEWTYLVAGARAAKGKGVRNRIGLMLDKAEGFAATRYIPEKYQARDPDPAPRAIVNQEGRSLVTDEAAFRAMIMDWIALGRGKGNQPDVIRSLILDRVDTLGAQFKVPADVRATRNRWAGEVLDQVLGPATPQPAGECLPRLASLPVQEAS